MCFLTKHLADATSGYASCGGCEIHLNLPIIIWEHIPGNVCHDIDDARSVHKMHQARRHNTHVAGGHAHTGVPKMKMTNDDRE